jgi:hypothetical protein
MVVDVGVLARFGPMSPPDGRRTCYPATPMSSRPMSSADLDAVIEWVTPDVLTLLPRSSRRSPADTPRTMSGARSCASTSSAGSSCRAAATPWRGQKRSRAENGGARACPLPARPAPALAADRWVRPATAAASSGITAAATRRYRRCSWSRLRRALDWPAGRRRGLGPCHQNQLARPAISTHKRLQSLAGSQKHENRQGAGRLRHRWP